MELTGQAKDLLTRRRAVMIAEGVKGVRAVSDRMTLAPQQRTDSEIRHEVESALLTNAATDSFEVEVSALRGVVTLRGTVQSWQEKTLSARVTAESRFH